MQPHDQGAFQRQLSACWALYGKTLSSDMLEIFWRALQPFPLTDVSRALSKHVINPDVGQYPPKPADLVRQLEGDTASQAMRAWSKAFEAMRRVGAYRSVVFDDPLIHVVLGEMGGWVQLCRMSDDETPFRAREFEKRYRSYKAERSLPPQAPKLCGLLERHNGTRSEHTPDPVLIGDTGKAQQVLAPRSKEPQALAGPGTGQTKRKVQS